MNRLQSTPRSSPSIHVNVMFGGKKIAEEQFDYLRNISVGSGRRNALVLPDESAPRSMPLFQRRGNGYSLHFDDHTHGAVASAAGAALVDLSRLHAPSTGDRHGFDLPLEEGAHGRIEVGEET